MRANCHLVTEMRLILGLASPPLGKCTGRSDFIALNVKGSRPRDSCSSRCAHFSFQRGSSRETTDSTPVHQYHSQITFFFPNERQSTGIAVHRMLCLMVICGCPCCQAGNFMFTCQESSDDLFDLLSLALQGCSI